MVMRRICGLLFVCFMGGALLCPGSGFAQSTGASVEAALKDLQASGAKLRRVQWYPGHERIRTLSGELTQPSSKPPVEAAYKFLEEHPLLFQTDLSKKDITPGELRDIGQGGKRVRLDQTYKGLSVFGGGMEIYLKKDNSIDLIHNYYVPNIDISITPAIPEKRITELAWNYFLRNCKYYPGKGKPYATCSESLKSELSMSEIKVELGVFEDKGKALLAYKVYFRVDRDGALFNMFELIMDADRGNFLSGVSRVIWD